MNIVISIISRINLNDFINGLEVKLNLWETVIEN